jgi:hypothetical protein
VASHLLAAVGPLQPGIEEGYLSTRRSPARPAPLPHAIASPASTPTPVVMVEKRIHSKAKVVLCVLPILLPSALERADHSALTPGGWNQQPTRPARRSIYSGKYFPGTRLPVPVRSFRHSTATCRMTIELDTGEAQNGRFWPILGLFPILKLCTGSLATAPLHHLCDNKVGYWNRRNPRRADRESSQRTALLTNEFLTAQPPAKHPGPPPG